MNDLQIEYFLTVARNLSFTKTAEELYVTQPAVSRQISFLEKELDSILFDRTNKSTILTDAGQLYFDFFNNYKEGLSEIKLKLKEINQGMKGRLRLGCMEGWDLSEFFPEVIELFLKEYPNVKIELECYSIKNLVQALKNDHIDVALSIDVTLENIDWIDCHEISKIQKIILFSNKHKLSGRDDIKPEDFKDETFFVISSDEAYYAGNQVKEILRKYGFTPKIQYVNSIESMNACVHNGMGVAVSDIWSSARRMDDFRYVPIQGEHSIVLGWKSKTDKELVHIFANELKFIIAKNR